MPGPISCKKEQAMGEDVGTKLGTYKLHHNLEALNDGPLILSQCSSPKLDHSAARPLNCRGKHWRIVNSCL